MKKRFFLLFVFGLSLLFMASSVTPVNKNKIRGWVYDSSNAKPLANVNVIIRGTKFGSTTDSNGYFQMALDDGKKYTIVFSHLGYDKVVRVLSLVQQKEVEYRIFLKQTGIELAEVTVTGERKYAKIPAYWSLKGDDLERLGQKNLERALMYYFPGVIFPWWAREKDEDKDFTLYVNGVFKETEYLDQIDPFSVKYVKIWKRNYSNISNESWNKNWNESKIEYTPIELPCRNGNYVVLIVTNDEESTMAK